MFHQARLAATALFMCASLGFATQANAGLSLADPEAGEALAAARSSEVCTPVKSATPVRQKLKPNRVAILNQPRAPLQFPLLLGVAY